MDLLLVDLIPLVPLVLPFVAVPATLAFARRARRKQVREWEEVARRLGLRDVKSEVPLAADAWLAGRSGARTVRIDSYRTKHHGSFVRIAVAGNSGVSLRPERDWGMLGRPFRPREVEVGDSTFDHDVEIHGAPDRVRALLDVETRGVVLRMFAGILPRPEGGLPLTMRGKVTLDDGDLVAVLPDRAPRSPEDVYLCAQALLALAPRFQLPSNVPERLAAALAKEPVWRVRLQGLQLLATSYPKDRGTLAALRQALGDEREDIRVQAAIALGKEARDTLLALAAAEGTDDATAAHAIRALGDAMPLETVAATLRQSLRARRLLTAAACVHALELFGAHAGVSELLVKVLAMEEGPIALAAVHALGSVGGPVAEDALLDALARDPDGLGIQAVVALGRAGTARAVLPVREAGEAAGAGGDLRRAARQAVAEIQARLPGATPGQISIAGSEAGQVSLADDDPRGRVSLPEAGA